MTTIFWNRLSLLRIRWRAIGRNVIAQHEDGHVFWSASCSTVKQNERNAVAQLAALARFFSMGSMIRNVDFSSRIR